MKKNNVVPIGVRVTNTKFLKAIFGEEWVKAHVTMFADDPNDIEESRRGICWAGGAARRLVEKMNGQDNQYFCISLFKSPRGQSVRQKGRFDATFVIVADDVNEKLPIEQVEKLPAPSYKLFTSEGSEQWGWILDEPCEDRAVIDNLLDGLVAKGLAPNGVDPGMKGVTRYVRLPEGYNTKSSRLIDGEPFKCYLSEWNPERLVNVKDLANTFGIDLYAKRNEIEGIGADVDSEIVLNHPVVKGGYLNITGTGANGWIRCDCPNVENHSSDDPSGAAIQIQQDGSLHFQCHHGHCNGDSAEGKKLTGAGVVKLLEKQHGVDLKPKITAYKEQLKIEAVKALSVAVGRSNEIADDVEIKEELDHDINVNDWIYIPTANRFFRWSSGSEFPPIGIDNMYLAKYPKKPKASEILLRALDDADGHADGYAWIPARWGEDSKKIIHHDRKRLINTWQGYGVSPKKGDATPWLKVLEHVIPDPVHRKIIHDWFAYNVQHPGVKLQWHIIVMGNHGTGKDSLLAPLMRIFGTAVGDISAEDLDKGWGDYFAQKKLVSMQEVYREQDKKFANMMKNFTASTSTGVRQWNMKGGKIINQPDVLSVFAFSNHRHCIALEDGERRYFVTESWVEKLDPDFGHWFNEVWLKEEDGAAKVFDYLLNVDLEGFKPGMVPMYTSAYYDLVSGGKYDYELSIDEMIENREGVFAAEHFTLKTLLQSLKHDGHKMGQKGVIRCIEKHGYVKCRGAKKIGGKTHATPNFYTNKLTGEETKKEIYEFYVKE